MKKWLIWVLMICLLSVTLNDCVQADTAYPLICSVEQLEQYLRKHLNNSEDAISFSYSSDIAYVFEDFEIVNDVFKDYGIKGWSHRHYDTSYRVEIFDIYYSTEELRANSNKSMKEEQEYPLIRSVEQLKQYLWKCTRNLEEKICFSYSPDIAYIFEEYDTVMSILSNCGAKQWIRRHYSSSRKIELVDIIYSPGLRITRAWALNRLDWLNEEELMLFDRAQKLVQQAMDESRTTLELERWFHDELCRSVEYTLNQTAENISIYDTAIGALLYGQAECDGYADAFYLLGTLAGLKVGFQDGESVQLNRESGHIWNVIEIDGMWYHVDVTWDDLDSEEHSEMMSYRYFNVGADMLSNHTWSNELSLYPLANYTNWNKFFYTCAQNGEQGFGAYFSSLESAAQYIARCYREGKECAYVMVKGTYDTSELHEYLKRVSLHTSWITWKANTGEYTLFDILFI